MKIAIVSSVFPPYRGGIGTAAYTEAVELSRRGHDVTVFVPRRGRKEKNNYGNKFKIRRLWPIVKYGNAAWLPQLAWKLKNLDIVHLHYPFFGGAEVINMHARKMEHKGVKIIITYHHDVVGKGWLGKFFGWHTKKIMPKILASADKIIVSSLDYAKNSNIKDILEKNPEKFFEIPFGVDAKKFSPTPPRQDFAEKFGLLAGRTVLFVGGLDRAHYFKGLEILIKAKNQMPNAKILVVGEGDLRPHYEKIAADFKISDKIIFAGQVSLEDLPNYYNLADAVVLPSIDRSEAFGIVLIEAAACGKPVVASNLPGVRSVVDYGSNGFTVEPGNVQQLAEKLNYLLDNPKTAKEFGENGRRKILEKYDTQKVGEKLEKLFLELK